MLNKTKLVHENERKLTVADSLLHNFWNNLICFVQWSGMVPEAHRMMLNMWWWWG